MPGMGCWWFGSFSWIFAAWLMEPRWFWVAGRRGYCQEARPDFFFHRRFHPSVLSQSGNLKSLVGSSMVKYERSSRFRQAAAFACGCSRWAKSGSAHKGNPSIHTWWGSRSAYAERWASTLVWCPDRLHSTPSGGKAIPNPPTRMVFIPLITLPPRMVSLCDTILNEREWRDEETGSHAIPSFYTRTYALDTTKFCIGR